VDDAKAILLPHAAKLVDRDARLRVLRRHERYSALSAHGAAKRMAKDFHRYASCRWLRERRSFLAPAEEPIRTWYRLLVSGVPFPGLRHLRRVLGHLGCGNGQPETLI
jgi:hypothetical protein